MADEEELPFEELLASKEVGCARQGQLIGEIAMMGGQIEGSHPRRALTGVCSTPCITLELNRQVFDIIGRDQMNKEREALARVIYDSLPFLKDNYTFARVLRGAPFIFKEMRLSKGSIIHSEDVAGDKIYLIKAGTVALTKKLT